MKLNDTIYAKTNAEFLNQLLNKNYQAWMKSSIKLPDGKLLWMIELKDDETASHWINNVQKDNPNVISELHVGKDYEYEHHGTYLDSIKRGIDWDDSDRVVFDKLQDSKRVRKYIFRGVFRLNKEKCSLTENVWEKISDQYCF